MSTLFGTSKETGGRTVRQRATPTLLGRLCPETGGGRHAYMCEAMILRYRGYPVHVH